MYSQEVLGPLEDLWGPTNREDPEQEKAEKQRVVFSRKSLIIEMTWVAFTWSCDLTMHLK